MEESGISGMIWESAMHHVGPGMWSGDPLLSHINFLKDPAEAPSVQLNDDILIHSSIHNHLHENLPKVGEWATS